MSATEAIREVQQKIGRNLIWVQLIEQRLKLYLSFVEPSGHVRLDGLAAETEKLLMQTFGNLVGRLRKTTKFQDARGETWLAQLVDSRNELTHHFVEKFGGELFGSVTMPTANAWLDQQRLDLRGLYGMISQSLAALFVTLSETTFKDDAEMKVLLHELATKVSTQVGNVRVETIIEAPAASE